MDVGAAGPIGKVLMVDDDAGLSEAVALLSAVGYSVAKYVPPMEKAVEVSHHDRHQGAKERARRLKHTLSGATVGRAGR